MRISDWSSDVCSSDLSIVTSPCVKLRFRSTSSSATSFITQHLHWVGIGRLVGRIERRKEAEDDHHDHDRGDLHRIGLRRQFGQETDRRVPQRMAGQELDPAQHPLPERSEEHTSELQSLMRISYAFFSLKKNT